jgi:lipopolysaccharide/colanic/teichoic acid biosynthesis glycosyltransferase
MGVTGGVMGLSVSQAAPKRRRQAAWSVRKRVFDMLVAALLTVALAPVLILIALAIYVDSGGSILFSQSRAGFGGKPFTMLKFRTMTESNGPAVWTRRGDSRITRVGAFLRRTSLDELPQLLHVLAGDMSLVGPRPHALSLDAEYEPQIGLYQKRLHVRPGITGLAQINDHRGSIFSLEAMHGRVMADAEYVDNWSFRLDLMILARTIPHLVASDNAY